MEEGNQALEGSPELEVDNFQEVVLDSLQEGVVDSFREGVGSPAVDIQDLGVDSQVLEGEEEAGPRRRLFAHSISKPQYQQSQQSQ